MNTKLIITARYILSKMALVILLSPVTASAYTSSGADGIFQPATSVVIDLSQPVFNFASIYIPSGVTVSFSGLSSPQTVLWLATGNIDIAGTLDLGFNNLWIETPGNISLSGTLNASGGTLTLVADTVNASGIINIPASSGNISPLPGGNITIRDPGAIILTPVPGIIMSPVPEPDEWAMLFLGLFVVFAALRYGNQNTQISLRMR